MVAVGARADGLGVFVQGEGERGFKGQASAFQDQFGTEFGAHKGQPNRNAARPERLLEVLGPLHGVWPRERFGMLVAGTTNLG